MHAHWLPAGAVALTTRKPFVVQVWGTDVELARRVPGLARRVLRRARLVIAPSAALADEARRLGARDVRTIPSGVDLPDARRRGGRAAGDPVRRAALAGEGRPRAGCCRRRSCRSSSRATARFAKRSRVRSASSRMTSSSGCYERAAVVACPSHREGFGVVCAEAMAHGRPVVARRRRRPARPRRPRGDGPTRPAARRGRAA